MPIEFAKIIYYCEYKEANAAANQLTIGIVFLIHSVNASIY